jgi:hypothetical protein
VIILVAILYSVLESLDEQIVRDGCIHEHHKEPHGSWTLLIKAKRWDFDGYHIYLKFQFGDGSVRVDRFNPPISITRIVHVYYIEYCDPAFYSKIVAIYDQTGIVKCD